MQKNVASQKWIVFAFDETDNTAKTGDANQITAEMSKNGAVGGGNIADTNPTELEDGYYVFDIAQGESDADLCLLLPESSTVNIQVIAVPGAIWTTEPNRNKLSVDSNGRMDLIKVAGTTQTANDNGADINFILVDTNEIQGKLPTNKFMGSSDGADDDGTLNTIDTNAARLTAVRAAVLTDLIDGNRLDLLIDAILLDTGTTLETHLTDVKGATFSGATDSLEAIRNRGDAAWAGAPESVSGTVVLNSADDTFDLTATLGTLSSQNDAYHDMIINFLDNSGSIFETKRIIDYAVTGGPTYTITVHENISFPIEDGVDTFVIYRAAVAPVGAASITEGDKNDIVDKMLDEETKTAHQTKDSVGYFLRRSGGRF